MMDCDESAEACVFGKVWMKVSFVLLSPFSSPPLPPLQAVMASDFALPRFQYLQKLLLVHGHWCYSRLANMILYFFYKNAVSLLRSHESETAQETLFMSHVQL